LNDLSTRICDNFAVTLKTRINKLAATGMQALWLFTQRRSSLCTAAEQGLLARLEFLITGPAKLIDVMIPPWNMGLVRSFQYSVVAVSVRRWKEGRRTGKAPTNAATEIVPR
jgi:hypothetical protein